MQESTASHPAHLEKRCSHYTSKRITRLELIVGIMSFVLLALLCDKIRSSPQYNTTTFVTKADINDREDNISSLQDSVKIEDLHDRIIQIQQEAKVDLRDMEHTITVLQNTIHHDSAEQASMISDLQDKIAQIQIYQFQYTEREAKHIDNDVSVVDEELSGELYLTPFNLNPVDKYLEPLQSNKPERKLQSSAWDDSQNHTHRCGQLPILSPINHLNNFEFNESIERTLDIIHTISSIELLNSNESPQYKAACWTIFDDMHKVTGSFDQFIQRYVTAVFLFTINPNVEDVLPPNTCDHQMVACNDEGKITKIEWSENKAINNVKATIPSELSNLRYLEHLRLNSNQMVGTIPTELGRLSNLQVLDLDSNNLTGTLPTELGKLINVTGLHLSSNSLKGTIPSEIGGCAQLEKLEISNNTMGGTIPKELFNCEYLQLLNFNSNSFIGSIPTEIGLSQQLLQVEFQNNRLSGKIPSEIGNLSSLQELFLRTNELTGPIPIEIGNLVDIKSLVMTDNKLNGTLPDIFGNFSKLLVLALSFNRFTGIIPNSIWNHDFYQGLILAGNDLRGNVPDGFCRQKAVTMKIDSSSWFVDEPKVNCECCENKTCYLWETGDPIVAGTLRPSCPNNNRYNISFLERYHIEDKIANVTLHNMVGSDSFHDREVCLSPTGCYTLYDSNKTQLDYDLNYTESSKTLSKQDSCGAVDICGVSFDINHPKRKGLNHLTQIAFPDISILDDPESPDYKALCWIMTNDTLYDEFEICDGTLLQRFSSILATFRVFFANGENEKMSNMFPQHTCDWDGSVCDSKRKFVEELNFPGRNLTGPIPLEISFFARLKRLDVSNNAFTGTIDPVLFTQMPNLEIINMTMNRIGGEIPKELFTPPKLKEVNISNNVLIGTLPTNISYSKHLEIVEMENNLLYGTIPHDLIECDKLEFLNLAKNNFLGTIPSIIGSLDTLRVLILNGNRLTGSIPREIFNASQIEVITLETNMLTGSIPSEIGNLPNARAISLSHNLLKGEIPKVMGNLTKIEFLHIHDNLLTGTAPIINLIDTKKINAFISDCGKPSFITLTPLECESCTMCCNSWKKCQINQKAVISMETIGYLNVSMMAIGIALFMAIIYQTKKTNFLSFLNDNRDPLSIYNEDSVYCLVFANNILAWVIYSGTGIIQALAFYVFLKRSNFNDPNTEWAFPYVCHQTNGKECFNDASQSFFGWFMLIVMLIYFLGTDFVDSILQLRKAAYLFDLRLFISGLVLFFLTALAFVTSIIYNLALAESDPELVVNAIFLLFINEMDEQGLKLLESMAPGWISKRYLEIRIEMEKKVRINEVTDDISQSSEVSACESSAGGHEGPHRISKRLSTFRFHGLSEENTETTEMAIRATRRSSL